MIAAPLSPAVDCPLCGADSMREIANLADEAAISRCGRCGLARGEHRVQGAVKCDPSAVDHFQGLDADRYLRSVGATRKRSYARLLNEVSAFTTGGQWLDVGCSYGWLLERVREAGYEPLGIEPSPAAASTARAAGLPVIEGCFPDVLPAECQPSVISFMDVLEHLPDPVAALTAARKCLAPGGSVVIQVPDQTCLLYQLAEVMCRVTGGRASFALRRLWLVGFDFPHRFYFTQRTLRATIVAAGLQPLRTFRTPIGNPADALDRVAYTQTGKVSLAARCVALSVAGINTLDALTGYGGLITMIAGKGNR